MFFAYPGPDSLDDLLEKLKIAFAESYSVEKELLGGGMSRLFLATDLALSRTVVIKILPPELTSDMMAARFKRESEVTARLQHPHILPIITAGLRDGLLYYVMPFISGESLRERLKRDHQLPISDATNILCEVASALAYAHKQGVIHRDIKPENILLQDGHAVLADFGIAAALAGPGHITGERLTRTGMSIGTVGYMAPEQSLGGPDVDSRADIYSLGVVAYEMFAGTPPFVGTSTQAVLAAHLTQPPPRLDDIRDDVPIPVSRAIVKALQKEPADRFQSASEFANACGLAAPRMSTLTRAVSVRKLKRIPKKKIALGLAFLAFAAATTWYAKYRIPPGPLETVTLVIAPFDAPTSDLKIWREGMVDLLARNMDGAGVLRTVSPTLAIRRWGGGASERDGAVALAKRTGARYAVYGNLTISREDSVRLRFGLVDAKTDEVLIEPELLDPSVEKLAGELSVHVFRALGKRHRIAATSATSIGSDSALAVKAFLQGEQHYRRTSWDSASLAYGRAIRIDSGFAIALRKAGRVNAWQKSETDSLTQAFALRAGAQNQGLPPRDSLLIAADSVTSALQTGDLNLPDVRLSRRLFTIVNEAAARYPNDPEVWYVVGEARFHHGYGSVLDVTEPEIREAFNRSIALDSAFSPAYIHLVALGFTLDGADSGRVAGRRYLARDPGGKHAEGVQLLDILTDPARSRTPEAEQLLGTASSEALFNAWQLTRRWPDSTETALRLLRAVARRPRSSPTHAQDSLQLMNALPLQLAFDGRLRESYLAIGNRPSRLLAQLALLGAVDADTASAVFARWLAAGTPQVHTALPWWAARRDTASIRAIETAYKTALAQAKPEGRAIAEYNLDAAQAYFLLATNEKGLARDLFAKLSDSLCLRCDYDHLAAAQLLAGAGRLEDADKILRQRLFSAVTPSEIMINLERGKIAQRRGDTEVALRAFRSVVGAWTRGDPEVQPYVREARQGIATLTRSGGG